MRLSKDAKNGSATPKHLFMNKNWYAIHTQAAKEAEAKESLRQHSITVFSPMTKEIRSNGSKRKFVDRPFFPRYIFANFDPSEHSWKVKHSRGVSGIVSCGEAPSVVPEFIMEEMYSLVGDDGYIYQAKSKKTLGFSLGETLVIDQGVWAGHEGIFQGESNERVNLLLSFLGAQRIVQFDYSEVSSKVTYLPIY